VSFRYVRHIRQRWDAYRFETSQDFGLDGLASRRGLSSTHSETRLRSLIRPYDLYGFKNEFQPLADTYLTRCRCSGIHPTQTKNANHEQMKKRILQSASDPGIKFLNKITLQ
jgi:hypothetical protein